MISSTHNDPSFTRFTSEASMETKLEKALASCACRSHGWHSQNWQPSQLQIAGKSRHLGTLLSPGMVCRGSSWRCTSSKLLRSLVGVVTRMHLAGCWSVPGILSFGSQKCCQSFLRKYPKWWWWYSGSSGTWMCLKTRTCTTHTKEKKRKTQCINNLFLTSQRNNLRAWPNFLIRSLNY